MADVNIVKPPFSIRRSSLVVPKSYQKTLPVNAIRKCKRNRGRIWRRKRSKLKYWARRKELRVNRKSQDLCASVEVFNITGMETDLLGRNVALEPLPEVSAWQHQHQVAYWKSRAISLEYENHMLYKHIQDLYHGQIQNYMDYAEHVDGEMKEVLERRNDEREEFGEGSLEDDYRNFLKPKANKSGKEIQVWDPPNQQQERKEKEELMNNLYGTSAPKIRGMETAIELNYDLYVEKHNPPMWPVMPLKL